MTNADFPRRAVIGTEKVGFHSSYLDGLMIEGLAPDMEDHRNSGFRAILKNIAIPANGHILDVGGFTGETTTVHLIDFFTASIDIVERHEGNARNLSEKFKDRAQVHNIDIAQYRPSHPYDLVVFDLDTTSIGFQYNEILPNMEGMIVENGKVIIFTIYNCEQAYGGENPMISASGRVRQEDFMNSYFGATEITAATIRETMWGKGYAVLGLVDKWMLKGGCQAFGWVYLQKLPR